MFRVTRPIVNAKMWLDRQLGRDPRSDGDTPGVEQPLSTPLAPSHHPVDIIVPVYKGLADTQRCVLSVLSASCRTPWRLIVINDASPEPEVTDWLRDMAARDPRVELLEIVELAACGEETLLLECQSAIRHRSAHCGKGCFPNDLLVALRADNDDALAAGLAAVDSTLAALRSAGASSGGFGAPPPPRTLRTS